MDKKRSSRFEKYHFHFFHLACFISWFCTILLLKYDFAFTITLLFLFSFLPIIIAIISLTYIVGKIIEKNRRDILISLTLIPLTIIYFLIGVGIMLYQPSPHVLLKINQKKMMEIVELVKTGELGEIRYSNNLPERYKNLSEGGEITIRHSNKNDYEIEFFIKRGLPSERLSIVYSEVNDFEKSQLWFGDHYEELAPNWYFVRSR